MSDNKIKCCICGLEERFIGDISLLKNELPVCQSCQRNFDKYTAFCKVKIHDASNVEFLGYSIWIDKYDAAKRLNWNEPKRVCLLEENNWNNLFGKLKRVEDENSKPIS